jgi:hypothetical protein
MTEELTIWQKWEAFVEALQVDPGSAIRELLLDNLAVFIPIALGIVGIIVLSFVRG